MAVTGFLDGLLQRLPWRRRLRVLSVSERPTRLDALLVPRTIVNATTAHLRASGEHGCEEFAFWSGRLIDGRIGIVTRVFRPRSSQSRGHVTIDDDAQLLAMTDLVHEHDELVLCQLHTHPADAFHSPADDEGALTDEIGFLSLVLPQFGVGGLAAAETFRRGDQGWEHEGRAIETGLVRVFGDVLRYEGGGWRDR